MITIKPAKEGVNVPKPDGKHLAAEGETVKRSAFWVRRLSDKDVEIVKPIAAAKAATKKGE
ncbi:DUF2635 domain-containing protein [Marinomonas primoryensis]|uniref:DUF2635 domain-containing protein n=2 Tax=Marinomonas primoryensis TaxID=178399 RepID=A0A2Z4PXY4_9GAMM|nr:DUF2635 domain-containing protein [Marinomonas primoryensis]AWY02238.1 DUF2635 domain-containing protein [Marinomonas primoryensis]